MKLSNEDPEDLSSRWIESVREYQNHSTWTRRFRVAFPFFLAASGISLVLEGIAPITIVLGTLMVLVLVIAGVADFLVARKYLRCPKCNRANTPFAFELSENASWTTLRPAEARRVMGDYQHCFWCLQKLKLPESAPNSAAQPDHVQRAALHVAAGCER